MPRWFSQSLLEYWSWNLKLLQIGEPIYEPRSLSDLHVHIIGTYLFAFTAYAHLLSMGSKSYGYLAEGFQLLLFCLVPTLPAIQIIHSLLDVVLNVLSAETWNWAYLAAAICGAHV